MNRYGKIFGFVGVVVGLLALTNLAYADDASQADQARLPHCIVELAPVAKGERYSETTLVGCYRTEAEMQAALGTEAETLVGRSYNWTNRNPLGGSVNWKALNSVGCTTGYTYSVDRADLQGIGSGWDQKISSSSEGKGGCGDFIYYDGEFSGTSLNCGPAVCPTMGSLDNDASSIEWGP